MPTTTINHILDPIGNRALNSPKPALYWRYVNMHRRYGVQIEWLHNGEKQTLHQQITMHCTGMHNEKAVWQIHKQHFFINEYKSENPMYELAIACAEHLYPVQCLIDKSGQLHNIINVKAIQQRFTEAQSVLLRNFGGPITEKYIQQTEEALYNPEQTTKIISSDVWLSLFFSSIYTTYDTETRTTSIPIHFPFYGFEQPLIFKTIAQINFNTDQETHTLTCLGELDTSALSDAIQYKYTPTAGSINITYTLDRYTHQIQNITAQTMVQTGDNETDQININAYRLTDKNKIEEQKSIQQEKKTNSWW